MITLRLLRLFSLCCPAMGSTAAGRFYNPPQSGTAGYFADNEIWTVGETQTIKWTTTFTEYTIALWQESLPAGVSTLDSIIFRSSGLEDFSERMAPS